MSIPSGQSVHYRRYSWASAGVDSDHLSTIQTGDPAAFGTVQHFNPSHLLTADEYQIKKASTPIWLKSILSRITPGSNKSKNEFAVTRRRLTKVEFDNDYESAPSNRTLTPGPFDTFGKTTASADLAPINPSTLSEEDICPTHNRPDSPPPTAVSGKSVTFDPATKKNEPARFHANFRKSDSMLAHSSPDSNHSNIDVDFLLNTRRRSTDKPIDKLKKHSSFLATRRLSSLPFSQNTGTTPITSVLQTDTEPLLPTRSASTSSTRSLTDRLRYLRFHSLSKKSSKLTAARSPTLASTLDDLPSSRPALEGRINYHISRLDRLRRRLTAMNTSIAEEVRESTVVAANLQRIGMGAALADLSSEIAWMRETRDGLKKNVEFHRGELERIKQKRMAMDAEEGVREGLPAVFGLLKDEEEWNELFSV